MPISLRNYSLSEMPDSGYFRISVKKEVGEASDTPNGLVSAFLHDEIQSGDLIDVGPPCGEFTIDPALVGDQPIVFLAGGIGVTPLLSMAKSLIDQQVLAPVYFIQAVKNSSVHAFSDEILQMISDKDFVHTRFLYDSPLPTDIGNGRCDRAGRIDAQLIQEWTPYRVATFYFCGPTPFMRTIYAILKDLQVEESRINFEFFGPKQELLNSAVA